MPKHALAINRVRDRRPGARHRDIRQFYQDNAVPYEAFERMALVGRQKATLLYDIRRREQQQLGTARRGSLVLYFAAGSGGDMAKLARRGARVVGIDFSPRMLALAERRLRAADVPFRRIKDAAVRSGRKLEGLAEGSVLLVEADIDGLVFDHDTFDYLFCYCTLPLLGSRAEKTLRRLMTWCRAGYVSVYKREKIAILAKYYHRYGFSPRITRWGLSLNGGFHYYCLPHSAIMRVMKEALVRGTPEEVGLGRIYRWHRGSAKQNTQSRPGRAQGFIARRGTRPAEKRIMS
jgi:SAM-dependent methyltransferase